jgi:hypothetical protein
LVTAQALKISLALPRQRRKVERMNKRVILSAAIAIYASVSGSQAQIISNGGFELPGGVPPGTAVPLPNGDPGLSGWIIGGSGEVALANGERPTYGQDFPPVEGTYDLVFDGGDNPSGSWIAQSFDTIVGDVYHVKFYVGRSGHNLTPDVQKLKATARTEGGLELTNVVVVAPTHGYSGPKGFTFIAATPRSTVEFLDTSTQTVDTDLLLDSVSVSAGTLATIEVSEVAICWVGSANRTYQVQYKSDLTTNIWVNLGSPIQGTGTSMCVRDAVLGQPRRFYQVLPLP